MVPFPLQIFIASMWLRVSFISVESFVFFIPVPSHENETRLLILFGDGIDSSSTLSFPSFICLCFAILFLSLFPYIF